ncbi:AbiV family abortive infection protein [Neobacillus niacini]|uniref:AbiV family abortive infection protein n=1 Tax=Neobacillus niacini TaxID=86668 RepID=UPI0021CB20F8|nr:AbiV family abortive infection protein [Neobacillus niacini]MCM3767037.1 AbiV family abortive infection protein [Neobacillus niacini]
MSFNHLKVEEIEKIFLKIYENACELLEEAELLYNHQKFARAYLCAHIAFEEFGKLPMLNSVAIDVYFGKKIDWKKLNKDIRNHHSKISQSYTTILLILFRFMKRNGYKKFSFKLIINCYDEIVKFINEDNWSLADSAEELYMEIENLVQLDTIPDVASMLNGYKNASLYADFNEGNFYKPNEKISKNICEFVITLAQIQRKFIELPKVHIEGFRFNELDEEWEYSIEYKKFIDSLDELEQLQKQK